MVYFLVSSFFFFFKQKTAYEMRISDWSSDVCSSDLCPSWWSGMLGPVPRNRTRQPPRLHSRRRRSMLVCRPRLRNGRTAGFRQSATRTRLSGSNGNPVLTPIEVAPPENITSPRLCLDSFEVLHDSREQRRTNQAAPA